MKPSVLIFHIFMYHFKTRKPTYMHAYMATHILTLKLMSIKLHPKRYEDDLKIV